MREITANFFFKEAAGKQFRCMVSGKATQPCQDSLKAVVDNK